MTSQRGDELIGVYMARLGAALAGVPADRRDEIVGEIASHIAEERARLVDESETDVRAMLDRIGEPAELADAAMTQPATVPAERRIGAVEILALILTPIVWPIGVILLWLSPSWSTRDKLIGTLLPPGGYPAVLVFSQALLWGQLVTSTCSSGSVDGQPIAETCTGVMALPGWLQLVIGVGFLAGVLLLFALPILVGIYMGARLRRWALAKPARSGYA